MGDWEQRIQGHDGGIMEGAMGTVPRRSVVFNTGMVLHGWLDLHEAGIERYDDAAAGAARFLTGHLRADGTWDPRVEYAGIPHTYNSRVALAMLRWARRASDEDVEAAARRQLDRVVARQRPNGWFDDCVFRPGMRPSTHGLAYTLRGLLESHLLLGEPAWLRAVEGASEVLIRKLEVLPRLAANYDEDWLPVAPCVPHGNCPARRRVVAAVRGTDDPRWLNAGLKAIEEAASHQEGGPWESIHGALPGSFPVWGRYAPLQYPNWATKFLADSLMLYEDQLA